MEWTELVRALLMLILGLISITCFAIGCKVYKCPDVVYNKHRDKLRSKGHLTKEEWEDAYRDILR